MRYSLVSCINGNFKVESEHGENLTAAKMAWHEKCRILENASDVIEATVTVMNEKFNTVEGFYEVITHNIEEYNAD